MTTFKNNLITTLGTIKDPNLIDIIKDLQEFDLEISGIIIILKEKQKKSVNKLITKFQDYKAEISEKIKEIKSKISEEGESRLNELNIEFESLKKEIGEVDGSRMDLIQKKREIKNIFKDINQIVLDLQNIAFDIKKQRKRITKKIRKMLGTTKYSINVKRKQKKEFEDYLKKEFQGSSIPEEWLNFGPYFLFNMIVKGNFDDIEKKTLKIIKDVQVNRNFIPEEIEDKDDFSNLLEIYKILFLSKKILNIPSILFDDKLSIGIKKGNEFIPIEEGSMGEIIGTLLNIYLQQEKKILVIDQPDAELDFDSLKKLIDIILEVKDKKQLIFVTHNPNIPVLGDADQIFFLENSYDRDSSYNTKERGHISTSGGFESMIAQLLELEGGESAIINRMNKYLLG